MAQAAATELDSGVTWDMTVGAMMEAEGITDTAELDTYAYTFGDFVQYGFTHEADESNPEVYILYVFKLGQLVMYGHSVDASSMPEGTDMGAIFDSMLATMSEPFGEPMIEDAQRFISQMNLMEEGSIAEGDIKQFAGWDLGGGTEVYLMNLLDESILYMYAYRSMLMGE
jgi:hypothetical protein